jgi:hypothetical protein
MPWVLLFAISIGHGQWLVCYDAHGKYHKAGGPYDSLQEAFAGMATLRGQNSAEGYLMR